MISVAADRLCRLQLRIRHRTGIVYGLLALTSTGVLDLVVQASAFGSAGSVTVVCFGLFTRFGGVRAAMATLIAGMGSYLVGLAIDSSRTLTLA